MQMKFMELILIYHAIIWFIAYCCGFNRCIPMQHKTFAGSILSSAVESSREETCWIIPLQSLSDHLPHDNNLHAPLTSRSMTHRSALMKFLQQAVWLAVYWAPCRELAAGLIPNTDKGNTLPLALQGTHTHTLIWNSHSLTQHYLLLNLAQLQ